MAHADDLQMVPPGETDREFASTAFLPDLNNNNTAELIYGAPSHDSTNLINNVPDDRERPEGGVYVIYGNAPFYENLDFSNLQPKQGFFIHNSKGEGIEFGKAVGGLGDWYNTGTQYVFFTQEEELYYGEFTKGRVFMMPLGERLYAE
jgi:hypothetical protein